jgi:hypothetical protein
MLLLPLAHVTIIIATCYHMSPHLTTTITTCYHHHCHAHALQQQRLRRAGPHLLYRSSVPAETGSIAESGSSSDSSFAARALGMDPGRAGRRQSVETSPEPVEVSTQREAVMSHEKERCQLASRKDSSSRCCRCLRGTRSHRCCCCCCCCCCCGWEACADVRENK